jgi:pimeloyl-ACP methyl ester carboxylesterase
MEPAMIDRRRLMFSALLLPGALKAQGGGDIGIVLMHGKQDRALGLLAPLARTISSQGVRVDGPTMPWAGSRDYDADYPTALDEIESAVARLRAAGAKRVAVGGQSFGANAALAFAGSGRKADAVLAIAPGHVPDRWRDHPRISASVQRAREMIAAGQGDTRAGFDDLNQGQTRTVRTSARNYLSFFDPDGLGSMPKSAASIPAPVPLLWIIGSNDRLAASGPAYAFDKAPKHPKSQYSEVSGSHLDTADIGRDEIVRWTLDALA